MLPPACRHQDVPHTLANGNSLGHHTNTARAVRFQWSCATDRVPKMREKVVSITFRFPFYMTAASL